MHGIRIGSNTCGCILFAFGCSPVGHVADCLPIWIPVDIQIYDTVDLHGRERESEHWSLTIFGYTCVAVVLFSMHGACVMIGSIL